jgi:hypothetical protein
MDAVGETRSSHHRGEGLKPDVRGLFKAIERALKTAKHTIKNKVPGRWLHINLLTQLTIEEIILNIKLRHGLVAKRGHSKKSANNSHMGHRGKSLIIITPLVLLKAKPRATRRAL